MLSYYSSLPSSYYLIATSMSHHCQLFGKKFSHTPVTKSKTKTEFLELIPIAL